MEVTATSLKSEYRGHCEENRSDGRAEEMP